MLTLLIDFENKITGQLVAVKILESLHEIIEEIEEEYRILRDLNGHANLPTFYSLYLKKCEKNCDDQLWIVMEVC